MTIQRMEHEQRAVAGGGGGGGSGENLSRNKIAAIGVRNGSDRACAGPFRHSLQNTRIGSHRPGNRDLDASPAAVIERYASRWSIEVAIEDARQVFGAGQARNRTVRAVERTIPFQLACQAIATCWYATAGHDPADTEDHRARAPWYTTKTEPSTADMAAKLRRASSPQDLRQLAPTSQHPKKSESSAWPGKTSPHNRESRDNHNGRGFSPAHLPSRSGSRNRTQAAKSSTASTTRSKRME